MYNNIHVNIGGGTFSGATSSPDPLTINRLNPIFLNQAGDHMEGQLDMKGNKIINVAHAVNKRYLDNSLRETLTSIDVLLIRK